MILRRILKNRIVYKAPIQSELNHPIRIAESTRKEHTSEPKQAIRTYQHTFAFMFLICFRGYSQHVNKSWLCSKSSWIFLCCIKDKFIFNIILFLIRKEETDLDCVCLNRLSFIRLNSFQYKQTALGIFFLLLFFCPSFK